MTLVKPELIVFDVNETLLDLTPLKKSVGKALDGREDLLPMWFTSMLHYSMVETIIGTYHSFGEIGTATLMMLAERQGIKLTYDEAKESIVPALESLPAHTDVVEGLELLSKQGFRLVGLSNTYKEGMTKQFTNAGIIDYFEKRYSVEGVKKFKPHPDVYQQVIDDNDLHPSEIMMVASHAWDLMGAKRMGFQTAFIARPNMPLYPNTERPDYVVRDLPELADSLSA